MTDRPVALVTGASGGIGREIARVAAAEGHDLVLVARSESALRELADEVAGHHGTRAEVVVADLADRDAPARVAAEVERLGLSVHALVNNAGFGVWGAFPETALEREVGMIDVNVVAPTALTKAFVGPMIARGAGRILNVASTAAFQGGPRMAVYYATKAYVLSLSVGLAVELEGTGVTVTVLCPGPTRTGFADRAGAEGSRMFSGGKGADPARVARAGWRAMERGERVEVVGLANRLGAFGTRLVPRGVAARVAGMLAELG